MDPELQELIKKDCPVTISFNPHNETWLVSLHMDRSFLEGASQVSLDKAIEALLRVTKARDFPSSDQIILEIENVLCKNKNLEGMATKILNSLLELGVVNKYRTRTKTYGPSAS